MPVSRLIRTRFVWHHINVTSSCRSSTSIIINNDRRHGGSSSMSSISNGSINVTDSNCNSTSSIIRRSLHHCLPSRRRLLLRSLPSIASAAATASSSSSRCYNLIPCFNYTSTARIYDSGGEHGDPPFGSDGHLIEAPSSSSSSSSSSMDSASSPTQRSRLRVSDILGLMEPKAFTIAETCTVLEGVSHLIKEKLASTLTGSSSSNITTICAE